MSSPSQLPKLSTPPVPSGHGRREITTPGVPVGTPRRTEAGDTLEDKLQQIRNRYDANGSIDTAASPSKKLEESLERLRAINEYTTNSDDVCQRVQKLLNLVEKHERAPAVLEASPARDRETSALPGEQPALGTPSRSSGTSHNAGTIKWRILVPSLLRDADHFNNFVSATFSVVTNSGVSADEACDMACKNAAHRVRPLLLGDEDAVDERLRALFQNGSKTFALVIGPKDGQAAGSVLRGAYSVAKFSAVMDAIQQPSAAESGMAHIDAFLIELSTLGDAADLEKVAQGLVQRY